MAQTIIIKLTGIIQIGRQATSHDCFSVEVFPPDRNGLLQIVVLGNGEPNHLTLRRDQAEKNRPIS
jgi:hypothetical protein